MYKLYDTLVLYTYFKNYGSITKPLLTVELGAEYKASIITIAAMLDELCETFLNPKCTIV